MTIELHPDFKKAYKKRISQNSKLVTKVAQRIALFQADPRNPLLKDHGLGGSHFGHRSFWITGNIRIVYEKVTNELVRFLDIGSHPQVY